MTTTNINMLVETELQKKFGYDAVCGYIRNPVLIKEDNVVEGTCAISCGYCKRRLPMEMDGCRVYVNL